jgi:hypothetical protein
MVNATVRVIAIKADTMTDHVSGTRGRTIIVSLPKVEDRYVLLGKIKRSLRPHISTQQGEPDVHVDPDFTPLEAQEQYTLRKERNNLNLLRSTEDKEKFYYAIRRNKVIRVSL